MKLTNKSLFSTLLVVVVVVVQLAPNLTSAEDESVASQDVASEKDRPNFVFIITDDQSPHSIGAYGNKVCQTPNIDRIAKEGLRFNDAHHMGAWSGAVCYPSRIMVSTGRTLWNIPNARGKSKNKEERQAQKKAVDEAANQSMAALFNAAGYDTFRTCKRGNTFTQANQHFQILHDQDKRGAEDEDGSAWHGKHAIDFLNQRAATNDDDPFLMFVGFSHPHDPRNGKPSLLKKYGAENSKEPYQKINASAPALPINYLPAHPFHHGHPKLRDEVSVQGVHAERSESVVRNEKGREYACIENIDQQVGLLLDRLDAMGLTENTYVFFTSDHGIAIGRHGLMGKQNLYEHTWRVPFLARGPGIKAGSEASGFIYLADVLPTMCDLAGITRPDVMDAKSFRSILDGTDQRIRDTMYGAYCGGTKPGMRSVKTSDGWKLIKYDVLDGKVRETQMFNLNDNPNELLKEHHEADVIAFTGNTPQENQTNLAADPAHAAKRKELEALLLKEQKRLGDPYRLWDQK